MKRQEILLKRLLFKSDAYIDDLLKDYDDTATETTHSTASLSVFAPTYQLEKFKANIQYMHHLVDQLENDDQINSNTIKELKDRVFLLSSIIDEKGPLSSTKTMSTLRKASITNDSLKLEEAERILKVQKIAQLEIRNELLKNEHTINFKKPPISPKVQLDPTTSHQNLLLSKSPTTLQSTSSLSLITSSLTQRHKSNRRLSISERDDLLGVRSSPQGEQEADSKMILEYNKRKQEEYSDLMAKMASDLKANTLILSEKVKNDKQILMETSDALSKNVDRIKAQDSRLVKLNAMAGQSTWMLMGIVILVMVVFSFTFVFMRIFGKQ